MPRRQRAGHVEMLGLAADLQVLARLEVHADLDDQPRVRLDSLLGSHSENDSDVGRRVDDVTTE